MVIKPLISVGISSNWVITTKKFFTSENINCNYGRL